jgi:NAD(P)H-flavin reductase
MTLDPAGQRPLLMVAGSTGLAPMKALIDQVGRDGGRRTHLYFGARSGREVYDRDAVAALDERHPWLTVITAVSDDLRWTGVQGLVGEVAAAGGEWSGHDVYVCGSPVMVEATVKQLMAVGVPEPQIRFEEFGEA